MHASSKEAAYDFAYDWYNQLLERTSTAVTNSLAIDGIPVTRALLERLGRDVDSWAQETRQGAAATPRDPVRLPDGLKSQIAQLTGKITDRHALVGQLREAYNHAVGTTLVGEAAAKVGDMLTSMRSQFLVPLQDACTDALRTLVAAVDEHAAGGGLAQLRTDKYVAWPEAEQLVPARFAHAHNEVLLIDANTFDVKFGEHVVASVLSAGDPPVVPEVATSTAVREVIANHWQTTGEPPTGGVVDARPSWRPNALDHEPGRPDIVPSRVGHYVLKLKPDQLLVRARGWVGRPRMPFDEFISASLRDYVAGEGISDSERAERATEIISKFRATLELAQPLVAVNSNLISSLHTSTQAAVVHKFSEVPFDGLPIGDDLVNDVAQRQIDDRSVRSLRNALTAQSSATRIDVFGSFSPLSPLAFSSLLQPLATGWASLVSEVAREKFWRHRRARRLVGGSAMTDQQRRAIVGGWYVARYTGRLRLPEEAHALDCVQVYDDELQRWVSFPHPLVVPESILSIDTNGYLPAVLLSFGLAMASANASSSTEPLLPYTVLRKIWDDTATGYSDYASMRNHPATRRLEAWVKGEPIPDGVTPRVPQTTAPTENLAALIARFSELCDATGEHYLRPGQLGARGGGRYSMVDRPEAVFAMPLFHEVAEDVYQQVTAILEALRTIELTSAPEQTMDLN
jgi:hypothetical protein